MTEPTDRERVAWELCEAERCMCECKAAKTRGACVLELAKAHRAIALGAKPPVDPEVAAARKIAEEIQNLVATVQKLAQEAADRVCEHAQEIKP